MKEALIAIDPMMLKGKNFERFCEKIRSFQKHGLFSETSIASVIHSALYVMPYEYYKNEKNELAKEARSNVKEACDGKFQFKTVRVLESNSPSNEEMIERLSRLGKGLDADVLIFSSNERKGLPYWFLGSMSETASLLATLPVLIFKTSVAANKFPRTIRLLICVDVTAPPSASDISWIAKLAKSTKAHLELVYVEPRKRALVDSLQKRKSREEAQKVLHRQMMLFKSKGADSLRATILTETLSIPHTIAEFAEKKEAWMVIATTPKRKRTRRLLLGSTARHILALSQRPFLSLRGP